MNRHLRNLTLWIAIFVAFVLVAKVITQQDQVVNLPLVKVLELGEAGKNNGSNARILKVEDSGGNLKGEFIDPEDGQQKEFKSQYIGTQDARILEWARKNNIEYVVHRSNEILSTLLLHVLLPIIILVGLWIFLMRQFQSGSNKAMSFGKSKAKLVTEGQVKVSFDDVAGIDEVKEELMEIIQFLKDPDRFSRLGGKIPKGALLYGPPGTGKTLIARAVAGEANVPFFSISGSDFVEMFVGVGASRVRDLFDQGKKAKPCLIYIDEIDAVGRHRFAGIGGGHDEREQTLNQLLVELDGFAVNDGVIVMASTNRPDVLDPALLRPGRFDRQIRVDLPDLMGREKILAVHTKELKMGVVADFKKIAQGTPGFSGADLANLCNEAALLAARRGKDEVSMAEFEEAKDRVMMGPERRNMVLSDREKRNTAFHEAGHALVARVTHDNDHRVHKVTIIPRGRSLGLTAILPQEEFHSQSRRQLESYLLYLMGGRAAEETVFQEMTTGAANDLQRATDIAHRMICEYGMSKGLGPRTFGDGGGEVFLGKDISRNRDYSEDTARKIDAEVQALLDQAYQKALGMLQENRDFLNRISEALLERETLDAEELEMLMEGKELPPLFREEDQQEKLKGATESAAPQKEGTESGQEDSPEEDIPESIEENTEKTESADQSGSEKSEG